MTPSESPCSTGGSTHGQEEITLDGTLSVPGAEGPGSSGRDEMPGFDSDSLLKAHVRATKVDLKDVFLLLGIQEPVTGTLQADFETDGPLGTPGGSGWLELDDGEAYGEPLSSVRAQGAIADQVVKLSSINITSKAGSVTGSGSYDIRAQRFQAEARGTGLDIANIEHLHTAGETVAGKLGFTATASGTKDDPRVEAHATLTGSGG